MLRNYLVAIFRRLMKDTFTSAVNILSLALGFSCFAIIVLYTEKEMSFDRFHHAPENIYRIAKDFISVDGKQLPDATTPPALAPALRRELTDVTAATRFMTNRGRPFLLAYHDKRFYEMNVLRVDSNFFSVFDFTFSAGSRNKPFKGIHSVLLARHTAAKYFGNEDPIGKVIRMNLNGGTDYEVTGILDDAPATSHFTFDLMIPIESRRDPDTDWGLYNFYTYVRLNDGTVPARFERQVQELVQRHQPANLNRFFIQPLTDIHLTSHLRWELGSNGDRTTVMALLIIGIFVMVMASINYVNLVTSQAMKRAKEVGVRKVTGGSRSSLVLQFTIESIVTVMFALACSVIIVSLALPFISSITGSDLQEFLPSSRWVITVFPASVMATGLVAAVYPAFYLSAFKPLSVLRGRFSGSAHGIRLRQALVVFQFTLSSVLIMVTLIAGDQLNFMASKDPGFDQEDILMLPNIRGGIGQQINPQDMVEDLKKLPGVKSIARADGVFGVQNSVNGVADKTGEHQIALNFIRADYEFIPTLGIRLTGGRNFSPEFISDSTAIILNEKAVADLGLKAPVIGQALRWDDDAGKTHDVTIVGVVNDFHFTSLHESIKPFGFILEVGNGSTFFLKLASPDLPHMLGQVENVWMKHQPEKPFQYAFQDEQMARLHIAERQFHQLFSAFTLLAIVIACLGLLGLITALAESRTKEIGIRKVLGSSVAGIVQLLSKEFIGLVLIALTIAVPLAWISSGYWLDTFAYHITVSWKVFLLAGGYTLLIVLATIGAKAVRAALANPVESLRSE